jgi:hypothetical protein
MKLHNVPLADIVWNPWRDKTLFPIDPDHVAGLRESIGTHGFFASLKGRRRNGKVELGCGHSRFEAARKAKLDTIPIFLDDIDDDGMLQLMTDENALQSGANPGAVMNEVAAVTRRLVGGLAEGTIVPPAVKRAFEDKGAIDRAIGKLRNGTDVHLAIGHYAIRRYLGHGNPDNAQRGERQVREAISALKQSGRYGEIVEETVCKYPPAVTTTKPAKKTEVAKIKEREPRKRILDERTANVFINDHQFHAFREAVTTTAAQKVIPVESQLTLAKQIMAEPKRVEGQPIGGATNKKHIGAPQIKKSVQVAVEEGMKQQRAIDKEEREMYLREQREERIDAELHSARASLRSLISALLKLGDLATEFPEHSKIGGFADKLDELVASINQFSRKLRGGKSSIWKRAS